MAEENKNIKEKEPERIIIEKHYYHENKPNFTDNVLTGCAVGLTVSAIMLAVKVFKN